MVAVARAQASAASRSAILGVPLGELGAERAEGVVHVRHAVAAGDEREAHGLHVRAVHRPVLGQRVHQPIGLGVGKGGALAAAHHGQCHRGDHDGERDDQGTRT